MVNATPWPLYPQERPGTHCIGGWVGPRASLDGCRKTRPTRTFFFYERNTLFYHLNNITRSTTDFISQLSHLQRTASQYTSDSAQMSYKHVLCVKKSQTTSASSPHLESIETMVGFEPSISAITRLPTYTLDHTATGIGDLVLC